uniref:ABC transmembrane type-2 domain-containing protein n=1 Tax=Dichotomaria marginata TaxID=268567 RepID=A0A1G4NSF9_9FLOR|nr:Hypothetical protein ycf38 [Dichotomaria marginata]SCW21622.1 Hypothetical protein ycf38 [Dichotomaria marginata]
MVQLNTNSVLYPNLKIYKKDKENKYYLQEINILTKRLIIQNWRRPSLLLTSIIQPLLWLLMFSALFQNAEIALFTSISEYNDFIGSGLIVFTAFTSSLNAGLPLMFDREFGFFNRLLSAPLYSRYSIIISSSLSIIISIGIQVASIVYICYLKGTLIFSIHNTGIIILTIFLLSNSIISISLILAFILPGHIELLAFILAINLPLLFSSTALAPLSFMSSWLKILASINPLSYAIEIIRYTHLNISWSLESSILTSSFGSINILNITTFMITINYLCLLCIYKLICNKFED